MNKQASRILFPSVLCNHLCAVCGKRLAHGNAAHARLQHEQGIHLSYKYLAKGATEHVDVGCEN